VLTDGDADRYDVISARPTAAAAAAAAANSGCHAINHISIAALQG